MDSLMLRRRVLLGLLREEYIIFADPVVEQICANTWGDGVGLYPSQAAAVTTLSTVFRGNTNIVSFNELGVYFTGLTAVYGNSSSPYGAFAGCTALKSIIIPPTVTTIGNSAFRGDSSLESISLPSGLTSISQYAFQNCSNLKGSFHLPNCGVDSYAFAGCTNIESVTIKTLKGINSFSGAGNNTGTLIITGNVTMNINPNTDPTPRFVHYVVQGNCTGQSGRCLFRNTAVKSLRVFGNCSMTGFSFTNLTPSSLTVWEFLELLGTVTSGNLFYGTTGPISGGVIHFGANGIAVPISRFGSSSSNTATIINRLSKIYVGPGESQAGDQAILDLYLADAAWAAYSSKLDLWYNYNGDYKTPPVIPT